MLASLFPSCFAVSKQAKTGKYDTKPSVQSAGGLESLADKKRTPVAYFDKLLQQTNNQEPRKLQLCGT